ncbi:hypothetical protein [Sulfurimonas sp. NW9]|uniref:hypothetical protein n=1 Tax=Sulfurimonas sp. NW9 TaxID=2922728 RepID=UPI003DA8DADB
MQYLEKDEFLKAISKVNLTTSSLLENSLPLFLPLKRIELSNIYKKFVKNNQILEIKTDLFDKVEVRGRLLGQRHKDILEVLLNYPKNFSRREHSFHVILTAYDLKRKLHKQKDKNQIIQQLKELSEFRLNVYSTNGSEQKIDYNFGFIDSVSIIDENRIKVRFTQEYTYFLAGTKALQHRDYIDDIVKIDRLSSKWSKELDLKSHKINPDFIKAVVRFMINNDGKNSQIRIDNLIEKLNLKEMLSESQLSNYITDLKRENVQEYLREKFGISLTNNEQTLTFSSLKDKKKYLVNGDKDV